MKKNEKTKVKKDNTTDSNWRIEIEWPEITFDWDLREIDWTEVDYNWEIDKNLIVTKNKNENYKKVKE